jgi:hypothetical protein
MEHKYKRFRIPNRDVKLTESEVAITHTRTFQRLFYLKQLGLAHLVYASATHTRAAHSIECLDEASKLLESLKVAEDDQSWEEVRMAALLHDIAHVPFSHTLEDENQVLPKHDKGERLQSVLNKLTEEVDGGTRELIGRAAPILMAISGENDEERDWRSDLVGNTICADLLAYITTDAAWTGIEKRPGYYRVYDYFKRVYKPIEDGKGKERLCILLTKGGLRTDIVSAILDLLDMRYALTERVIFHHAKAMASAMLGRAARLVDLSDGPHLWTIGDEAFLDYLNERSSGFQDKQTGEGAKMLLDHLRSRRLYKRIFKVQRHAMEEWDRGRSSADRDRFCSRLRQSAEVERLLNTVENRFDIPRGGLVLWCPEGKSGMKLVKVNVVWDQANGLHTPVELRSEEVLRQFPGVHERVETIEKQYLDLWTFWVGIHPDYIRLAPSVVDAISSELEIECDPVFIETYAKTRLPGFADAFQTQKTIDNTWRTQFMPAVSQRLMDAAARDGSAVDSAVVAEAIRTVSEERQTATKQKATRKQADQPELIQVVNERKVREPKE